MRKTPSSARYQLLNALLYTVEGEELPVSRGPADEALAVELEGAVGRALDADGVELLRPEDRLQLVVLTSPRSP